MPSFAIPRSDEELDAFVAEHEFADSSSISDATYFEVHDKALERIRRRDVKAKNTAHRSATAAHLWYHRHDPPPPVRSDKERGLLPSGNQLDWWTPDGPDVAEVIEIAAFKERQRQEREAFERTVEFDTVAVRDMSKLQRELLPTGEHEPDETWSFQWGQAVRIGTLSPEEVAAALDRFESVDLGEIMRDGVRRPEMLLEGALVKRAPHRVFGPQSTFKTWWAAWLVKRLIESGQTVIWVDKEMGPEFMAQRFLRMGVDPAVVSDRIEYLPFATWDNSKEARDQWRELLALRRPALVVIDAQMEVLADADLNENSSADVLKWNAWYVEPAIAAGASSLMIDHTGHDEKSRSRGASGKGQSSRVEFSTELRSGLLAVMLRKNAVSADIAQEQLFKITESSEVFELEYVEAPSALDSEAANREATRQRIERDIVTRLREHGELTQTQVNDIVTGAKAVICDALTDLVDREVLTVRKGARGALFYGVGTGRLESEEAAADEDV